VCGRKWGGGGRGINQEEQNNNVHVAKLSDEVDIARRRRLSLKKKRVSS